MSVASIISLPTTVFGSWKAGRQCMNFTFRLPVAARRSALTWYGRSRSTRSFQTSLASPIDTHTSVWTKPTPSTPAATSSVIVIRAPVRPAISSAAATTSAGGASSGGPTRRTSAPMSAPITSSERPMLNRQSPTKA